eukprot:14444097-Alexandrium_andersonii.AAC.1
MVAPEPADACDCLVDGVVAHASLAQHRARHDRTGVAIFDHQRRRGGLAGVPGEKAIVHCNLWRIA